MFTIVSPCQFEQEVKHSRFVASAAPAQTSEDALAFVAEVGDAQATHNCWAYRIGEAYRFSDDGEPGGTAGRPILAAIDGQHVDRVVVVVTRWFGGIKLGAGGLVRAYGGVAAECLRRAPRTKVRRCVLVAIQVLFEDIGAVYPVMERAGGRKLSEDYGECGVQLQVEVEEKEAEALRCALRDATRGRVKIA